MQPQGNKTSLYREGSRQSLTLIGSHCCHLFVQKSPKKQVHFPRLFQVEAEVSGRVSKHKEKTKISWHLGQSEKNLLPVEVTFEMQFCFVFLFLPSFPPTCTSTLLCISLSSLKYYKSYAGEKPSMSQQGFYICNSIREECLHDLTTTSQKS